MIKWFIKLNQELLLSYANKLYSMQDHEKWELGINFNW